MPNISTSNSYLNSRIKVTVLALITFVKSFSEVVPLRCCADLPAKSFFQFSVSPVRL